MERRELAQREDEAHKAEEAKRAEEAWKAEEARKENNVRCWEKVQAEASHRRLAATLQRQVEEEVRGLSGESKVTEEKVGEAEAPQNKGKGPEVVPKLQPCDSCAKWGIWCIVKC